MDRTNFSDQVAALEKLSKDEKSQLEIGKRLIKEVAQAVYEEKQGAEISNPDVELVIRKGENVPPQFRDRIKTDDQGFAISDAVVQHLNLIIWLRIWIRFWLRIIFDTRFDLNPLNRFQEFSEHMLLNDEELKLVNRLKKII